MKKNYILNITNNQTIIKEETAYQSSVSDIAKKPLSATYNTMKAAIKDTFNVGTYVLSLASSVFSKSEVRKAVRANFLENQKKAEEIYGKAFNEVQDQTGLNILTFAANPQLMFSFYGTKKIKDEVKETILDDPNLKGILNIIDGPKNVTDWLLGKSSESFNKAFADSPVKIFKNVFKKSNFKLYDDYGRGYLPGVDTDAFELSNEIDKNARAFKNILKKVNIDQTTLDRLSAREKSIVADIISSQRKNVDDSHKRAQSMLVLEKEGSKISPVKSSVKDLKELIAAYDKLNDSYKRYMKAVQNDIKGLFKSEKFNEMLSEYFEENNDSKIESSDIEKGFKSDISTITTIANLQLAFVNIITSLFENIDKISEDSYDPKIFINSLNSVENNLSSIKPDTDNQSEEFILKIKNDFIKTIKQITSSLEKSDNLYSVYKGLSDDSFITLSKEMPSVIKEMPKIISELKIKERLEEAKRTKTLTEESIQKLEEKYNTANDIIKNLESASSKVSNIEKIIKSFEGKTKKYLEKQQTESGEDEQG